MCDCSETIQSTKKSKCCDPCHCHCEEKVCWPPEDTNPSGDSLNLHHIYVPGDYNDINDALDSVSDSQEGYHIHLQPNTRHTIIKDHNMDTNHLIIEGDLNSVKGNAYFHELGQNYKATEFDTQYNCEEGGLGPYTLCTPSGGGRRITVEGYVDGEGNEFHPNFDSLEEDSVLMFHHKAGHVSDHCVCKGCGNTIYLKDCLVLDEDEVQKGEGFYINPSVIIQTCTPQIVTVQGRLEYKGLKFDTAERFVTGATGGNVEMQHSVMSGNMHQVGMMDTYFPNVITGQMHHSEDTGGTAFHQAVIGSNVHDAVAEFHSNSSVRYSYGLVVRSDKGIQVTNSGKLTTKHTDFCDNTTATTVSGHSHHNISGSRFFSNGTAVDASHGSAVTAIASGGYSVSDHEPMFQDNTVGISVNNNSHAVFDDVTMSGNADDATHDGVAINDLSVHVPETPGTKNSTFVFDNVN